MARLFGNPGRRVKPKPTEAEPKVLTEDAAKTLIDDAVTRAVEVNSAKYEGRIGQMQDDLNALRGTPAPVPAPVAPVAPVVQPGISDQDIDTLIASGEPGAAAKIRARVNQMVTEQVNDAIETHVKPLATVGLSNMAAMASHMASSLPHYKRFEKEIQARVTQLDPGLQSNPEAIKMIHDQVVGVNHDLLVTEQAEAKARQDAEAAGTAAGSAVPGQTAPSGGGEPEQKTPTPEDLGGAEALAAMGAKDTHSGKDPDALAQSMGYENWDAYMEVNQQIEDGTYGTEDQTQH